MSLLMHVPDGTIFHARLIKVINCVRLGTVAFVLVIRIIKHCY